MSKVVGTQRQILTLWQREYLVNGDGRQASCL